MKDEAELRRELERLDAQIDAATGWGAGLAAKCERRDGIASALGLPPRRTVGGQLLAD